MLTYNPSKSVWFNPNIEYLFDDEIIEYDMRDGGFSLIKQYQLLSPEKIRELSALGKGEERHKAIGNLQKDKEFSKALMDKFAEARTLFISFNHLEDDQIISVKKDAFFVTGKCKRRVFGKIEFVPKNQYSSYIRLPNLQNMEFYYSSSGMDVKGMGETSLNRHRIYLLEFVRKIFEGIETHNVHQLRRMIKQFVDEYKSGDLDEAYYLEFNDISRNPNPVHNFQQLIVPLVQIVLKELV